MATEILAVGSTDTESTDFTVAAGDTALLILKAAASGKVHPSCNVEVQRKDSATVYTTIDEMGYRSPTCVIENVTEETLTFRAKRSGGFAVGVDRV